MNNKRQMIKLLDDIFSIGDNESLEDIQRRLEDKIFEIKNKILIESIAKRDKKINKLK